MPCATEEKHTSLLPAHLWRIGSTAVIHTIFVNNYSVRVYVCVCALVCVCVCVMACIFILEAEKERNRFYDSSFLCALFVTFSQHVIAPTFHGLLCSPASL